TKLGRDSKAALASFAPRRRRLNVSITIVSFSLNSSPTLPSPPPPSPNVFPRFPSPSLRSPFFSQHSSQPVFLPFSSPPCLILFSPTNLFLLSIYFPKVVFAAFPSLLLPPNPSSSLLPPHPFLPFTAFPVFFPPSALSLPSPSRPFSFPTPLLSQRLPTFSPLSLFSPPSSPLRSSRILFCSLPTVFFPHLLLPAVFSLPHRFPHLLPAVFSLPHRFLPLSLSHSSQHGFLWRQLFLPSSSIHPLASSLHLPAYSPSSGFPPLPLLPSPSSPSSPGLLPPTVFFPSHRFLPMSSHRLAGASVSRNLLPTFFSPSPHRLFSQPLISAIFFPSPTILFPFPSPHLLAAATSCRAFLSPSPFSPLPLPTVFAPDRLLAHPLLALSHCLSPRSSPRVRAPVSLPPVCLCAQAAP
uniref:Uncharacterized protein n=1 Tax=Pongo abelii TaxID=9601 RepID=A0A8I5TN33_PONAB